MLVALDYLSVLVFALTGALTASRAQLDLVGFAFLASLTGLGGGTLRDVLLDRNPIWIADPAFLGICVCAALLVFFTAHRLESRLTAILWLDAAALSVAVAAGAGVTHQLGQPGLIVVVMGMLTGCAGGLMRDVVANEVPLVLKRGEIYVTAALLGSMAILLTPLIGLLFSSLLCGAITFTMRAGSIRLGWSLPTYKPRPPRR